MKTELKPSTIDQQILSLLCCPRSRQLLSEKAEFLVSQEGEHQYPILEGAPDLRCLPQRYSIDFPWYEPWNDLEGLTFTKPEPHRADDLPYHLDPYLASVFGDVGENRLVLEIGCGERQCEAYFKKRNFRYVGTDVDRRGQGPHLFADAHNLPFQDNIFDFYTSMAVYEHLISPITAASEAMRVLKPGGTFCGTVDFVYGFHDRASFYHMSHAGMLSVLRTVGFQDVKIWVDWSYASSIADMGYGGSKFGIPWKIATEGFLKLMDQTFVQTSNLARRMVGKRLLDVEARKVQTAGALAVVARKPV